jgi:hypothetical protein
MQQRLSVIPWSIGKVLNSVFFASLKFIIKTLKLRSYDVAPGKYTYVHISFFLTGCFPATLNRFALPRLISMTNSHGRFPNNDNNIE